MEVNDSHFNRRLQDVIECYDVRVLKVQNEYIRVECDSEQLNALFKLFKMLNQRNGNKMLLRRVESYARNRFLLTILLLKVSARYYIDSRSFLVRRSILISQHLEIVLEDVDNFVGLKSGLNSVLCAIDKLL